MTRAVFACAIAVAAAALLVGAACSSSSSSSAGGVTVTCPPSFDTMTCPSPPPSWKNEVEPLFAQFCTSCHGPGGVAAAQVPLGSYQDVFDNRTRSTLQIYDCLMPNTDASVPASAFPSAEQRQTMITWLDPCGAPNN
jgi:hypothetical protein